VAELCREDPAEAERCVVRLSGLLRAVLDCSGRPSVPLGKELDLCADYLDLCRARFGARLEVAVERDPAAEGALVPSLSVQVLCENAVRHGVERAAAGGLVKVVTTLEREAGAARVRVRVESPGPFRGERVGGLGLETARRRLALSHGEAGRLEVRTSEDGARTIAELVVPAPAPVEVAA